MAITWQTIVVRLCNALAAIGLIVLIGYLVYVDIDVDGKRVVQHGPLGNHILVDGPGPEQRVTDLTLHTDGSYWTITIDPVYFQVILPYHYDSIDVAITYRAPGVPVVQLGSLASEKGWNFFWQGLQNEVLVNLDWDCLRDMERGWWLCQRDVAYSSIEDFLLAPPRNARIINYNFPLPEGFDRLDVMGFNHELDFEQFDYVIATFTEGVTDGDWVRQELHFPIDSFDAESISEVQFALSAPGLDSRGQTLDVKSIEFTLTKKPLTTEIVIEKGIRVLKRIFTDRL